MIDRYGVPMDTLRDRPPYIIPVLVKLYGKSDHGIRLESPSIRRLPVMVMVLDFLKRPLST